MKTLRDIENLQGVRVLLRTDFNVPVQKGVVVDDFRIRAALPTIEYLRTHGAKVIITSHLEVVDGEKATLKPMIYALKKLGVEAEFVTDYKAAFDLIENKMKPGDCILLENLRDWPGEKDNDKKFAQSLASLADIYVNDAFSVSHREHASIVGVPEIIPGYAGLQLEKEVEHLSKAFSPAHPFLFILGGAKFETKFPLVSKFTTLADSIFIGGALANDLFKAKGYEVGISRLSKTDVDLKPFIQNPKILRPVDVTTQNGETKSADSLLATDKIMDAGPATLIVLKEKVAEARFILWNGPLGLYEDGYRGSTLELAKLIGEATLRGAVTLVGGGDTIAAIAALKMEAHFSFISTGGGAMLDFLAKGSLPGIDALK